MQKRLNANMIIALCTGCGMIAFAFYERYGSGALPPAATLYLAAAGICLLPVVYGLLRHQACKRIKN